ncbi:hypothetical protein K2173_025179 [Erythroxylum novogranatense]|uniref:Uncharacterized protein n=1 Tax=Erythroxylum novogranatense TaxID=1862640 RepID=A0AAV8SVM4_9ROSI|nr:hypothetical protein K2173_025179 [Erythroxylum novogranatense]
MPKLFYKFIHQGKIGRSRCQEHLQEEFTYFSSKSSLTENFSISQIGEVEGNCWVPDERTGIYYPKGLEKVMEGIPPAAGKDIGVNWFRHNDQTLVQH